MMNAGDLHHVTKSFSSLIAKSAGQLTAGHP